jgi:hypothetical protein
VSTLGRLADVEDCVFCDEPIYGEQAVGVIYTEDGPRHAHQECSLREVLGGIGHHIAHEYWCVQKGDTDAGLTRRQSAKLVRAMVEVLGVEEMAKRGVTT